MSNYEHVSVRGAAYHEYQLLALLLNSNVKDAYVGSELRIVEGGFCSSGFLNLNIFMHVEISPFQYL